MIGWKVQLMALTMVEETGKRMGLMTVGLRVKEWVVNLVERRERLEDV